MPRIRYEDWKPKGETVEVIAQANEIATNYRSQGYDLTLRQLYYQFVSRGLIPNTEHSYKRLGSIVNRARMAGLLDWSYIVDRTRNIAGVYSYPTVEEQIASLADGFFVDHWTDQPYYVEVWVEKEALAGVIGQAARTYDAPYFSCRGYVSQSEQWGAAQRLLRQVTEGKRVLVLHLGDHDPSGIDMTRDIIDRINTFTTQDYLNDYLREFGDGKGVSVRSIKKAMADRAGIDDEDFDLGERAIEIRRIALNMDQVEQYDPPPNPAKMTDSRIAGYMDRFGNQSWELDALEPAVLDALIQDHLSEVIDHEAWGIHDDEQETERRRLRVVADRFAEIVADLDGSE